jgi:two-component system response regulator
MQCQRCHGSQPDRPTHVPRRAVLLVDDDPLDLELTARAIHAAGTSATVQVAENGRDALEAIEREMPDLVLLDLKMPKVSGHRVLELLRRDPRTARLPIVILSNSDDPTDLEAAQRNRADGYLVKPVGFDEYNEAIVGTVRWWLLHNRIVRTPRTPDLEPANLPQAAGLH